MGRNHKTSVRVSLTGTVILVFNEMRIIVIINYRGTKCLTELIKWDAVLQLFNEHYR